MSTEQYALEIKLNLISGMKPRLEKSTLGNFGAQDMMGLITSRMEIGLGTLQEALRLIGRSSSIGCCSLKMPPPSA